VAPQCWISIFKCFLLLLLLVVARPLSYLTSQAALQQMAVTTPSVGKAGKVKEGASGKTVEITT